MKRISGYILLFSLKEVKTENFLAYFQFNDFVQLCGGGMESFMKAEFSEILKKLRTEKGLSQTELAKRIGVNKSIISAYENQERLPSLNVLVKLTYQFNVSMEYLLGVNRNKTVDVSKLTPEQISVITSLIEQFELSNR